MLELPFGPNRAFLEKGGRMSKALDGFSVSGDFDFATGLYYTPQYVSTAAQIAAGSNIYAAAGPGVWDADRGCGDGV